MIDRTTIDALFPSDLPEPEVWEQRYPTRTLVDGAMVTRFCPSPTGHMHIGGIYAAMLDKDLAVHSDGTYFVRIEDTDQAREIEGAKEQFATAFAYFDVEPLEDDGNGSYGPYLQSERAEHLPDVRAASAPGRSGLPVLRLARGARRRDRGTAGGEGADRLLREVGAVAGRIG